MPKSNSAKPMTAFVTPTLQEKPMARFIVIAAASGIGQATVKLLKAAAAQPSRPSVASWRMACPAGSGQRCGTR